MYSVSLLDISSAKCLQINGLDFQSCHIESAPGTLSERMLLPSEA